MDGYAIRSADTARASESRPARLRIVGWVSAGAEHLVYVGVGEAVSIATGARIPPGSDAVVRVEDVTLQGQHVSVQAPVAPGRDVRRVGEDVRRGEVVLRRGQEVRAAELGLLAALGRAQVAVVTRPRVAILTTGDELASPGQELRAGQLYNANLPALVAQATEGGGIAVPLEAAPDDREQIRASLEEGLGCDALVVSAGVSVGERDLVRSCLAELGSVASWRLNMRPVRPFAFGRIGRTAVFALPGNPVASQLAFELLVRPALRALGGHARTGRPELVARLAEPLDNRGGVLTFVRGALDYAGPEPAVRSAGGQGTANLATMTRAQCLIVAPAGSERLEAGARVRVRLLAGDA